MVFLVRNRKREHHYPVQPIQNSLDIKFYLKQIIQIFLAILAQKR